MPNLICTFKQYKRLCRTRSTSLHSYIFDIPCTILYHKTVQLQNVIFVFFLIQFFYSHDIKQIRFRFYIEILCYFELKNYELFTSKYTAIVKYT